MLRRTPLLLLIVFVGCSSLPEGQRATKPASGPAEVRRETVEDHAAQFDVEEPERPAGSQQEFAASAYIVAHLTEAGYVSRLDAVPVEDLVRSTNVVALPPSGEDPDAIVVVSYDSTDAAGMGGAAIGVWLEVARALRVVDPDHSVQFVALGAEHTEIGGGSLGSRRLARQLTDEGSPPQIVAVEGVDVGSDFVTLGGGGRTGLERAVAAQRVEIGMGSARAGPGEVFDAAGFDFAVVGGGAEPVGRVLLAYLSDL